MLYKNKVTVLTLVFERKSQVNEHRSSHYSLGKSRTHNGNAYIEEVTGCMKYSLFLHYPLCYSLLTIRGTITTSIIHSHIIFGIYDYKVSYYIDELSN